MLTSVHLERSTGIFSMVEKHLVDARMFEAFTLSEHCLYLSCQVLLEAEASAKQRLDLDRVLAEGVKWSLDGLIQSASVSLTAR
eukprot:1987193-Amphidinium_carterae.1